MVRESNDVVFAETEEDSAARERLFHPVRDLGQGGAGAFLVELSTGCAADAKPADDVAPGHDCHAFCRTRRDRQGNKMETARTAPAKVR